MKLRVEDITPALMIVNEEYWIHYVLRDILKVFRRAVVIDTGSKDSTVGRVIKTAADLRCRDGIKLMRMQWGDSSNAIGNGRNVLRSEVKTHWMMLVDGDEIWTIPQLQQLLSFEVPDDTEVCMVGGRNVQLAENGTLAWRVNDVASYDRLFSPSVHWNVVGYPFESHGLEKRCERKVVQYLDHSRVFHWHVRHTKRSSRDGEAFFRDRKRSYYPYSGPLEKMPTDWLSPVSSEWSNPYL